LVLYGCNEANASLSKKRIAIILLEYEQNPNQLMTLYEVTNEMRKLKGLKPLKVNNDIAHIASINLMN
jgi:uncharacterized protein YkwD